MKIVIATDSFKGSLAAEEACAAIREGLLDVRPDLEIALKPMADGGEGTARALLAARGGEWRPVTVTGPLPDQRVAAGYARFPTLDAVLVEMAAAAGLTLLRPEHLDPLHTTTAGVGELLRAATTDCPRRLWLAVGGSATVDGGVGAAQALGWRFLDAAGRDIGFGGGALERLARIERPPALALPPIDVLCDTDDPLTGPRGAARVYGPQKGATPEDVERLDAGLAHLASRIETELGVPIAGLRGGGAAGGLAAGAVAFFGARLVSGIETVMDIADLRGALTGAAWVVTGEGRFDDQSLRGKVVSGVIRVATAAGARVAVLAGRVRLTPDEVRRAGVAWAQALQTPAMNLAYALSHARDLLRDAARSFARQGLAA